MRKGASCGKEAERIIVRNGRLNGLDSQSSWKRLMEVGKFIRSPLSTDTCRKEVKNKTKNT